MVEYVENVENTSSEMNLREIRCESKAIPLYVRYAGIRLMLNIDLTDDTRKTESINIEKDI